MWTHVYPCERIGAHTVSIWAKVGPCIFVYPYERIRLHLFALVFTGSHWFCIGSHDFLINSYVIIPPIRVQKQNITVPISLSNSAPLL